MNNPNYLYHYTNIDTLALILENRTIRFMPLNTVDDTQENETADINNIGQFCYISSWTNNETESIPMWNEYASLNLGVRIGLKCNPFIKYTTSTDELSEKFKMPLSSDTNKSNSLEPSSFSSNYISLTDMIKYNFLSADTLSGRILHKVQYTNSEDKIYPKIHSPDSSNSSFSIDVGKLGLYKNLYWEYQQEYRYRFVAIPFKFGTPSAMYETLTLCANRMLYGLETAPFPYYDMTIDEIHFSNMEIILGPKISNKDIEKVLKLVKQYNPTASVLRSSLTNLIR